MLASSPSGEWLPPYLAPFFVLSHRTDPPEHPDSFQGWPHYLPGPQDICFIITCMAFMAIARDILRIYIFEPFAEWRLMQNLNEKRLAAGKKANGHSPSKQELRHIHRSVLRFAEQGWSAVYYPIQFCFGVYVNYSLPTQLFNYRPLWDGYPHVLVAGPLKFYYLTQTAFYTHQILILHAEAPRKDHYQMLAHHIITVFLMAVSYYFHFTRVGSFIMVLMDTCDIFLPIAKMMRYLEVPQAACDSIFALFVVSWFFTRHIVFLLVIVSVWYYVPALIPIQYFWMFWGSLAALQVIQLFWFATIVQVIKRVVTTGEGASDVRSDDED
uniref:Longevity-assurance protein n=1 Tax=Mycena chlorophos TaxID=658473 RepID=A0ABQ0LSY3_MYCCL|nr:longevity-assurance protein [Mycena chlorophos]